MSHTVVIGAGPAGLTTAYELLKRRQAQHSVTLLEASDDVGGSFRTQDYCGYRIDLEIGGFSTQDGYVQQIWDELVGEDCVEVEVRSLIHYRHRLFKYPLSATNAFKHLGPIDIARSGISYLASWMSQQQALAVAASTSEAWVSERFGPHFSRIFFDPYFEKIWGTPASQLAPSVARHALARPSGRDSTLMQSLIDAAVESPAQKVAYPTLGNGQVWKKCKGLTEQAGATFALNTRVIKLVHDGDRVMQAIVTAGENIQTIPIEHLVSSLPLAELVTCLSASDAVQASARCLRYRHIVQVALVLDVAELLGEQSLYVNHPEVLVGRIQNFKNWSLAMVPDADKTCLGLTYFCDETDATWQMDDASLVQLAGQELVELGLIESSDLIASGIAIRQPCAYPVHTVSTLHHLAIVQDYLSGFTNLQTLGRQGLHRYAKLDEHLLNGKRAAENILTSWSAGRSYTQHDLWEIHSQSAVSATKNTF